MKFKIVYNGNIYTAYYDFKNKKITYDEDETIAISWPDDEEAQLIEPPENAAIISCSYSSDTIVDVDIYPISDDEYSEYIEYCKQNGFSDVNYSYDASIRLGNENGYTLSLIYEKEAFTMSLKLYE